MTSAPLLAARGLAILAIAMGIGRFAFTPMLPLMQDAGLSLAAGGWIAAANYAGYLAGALIAFAWPMPTLMALRAGLVATVLTTAGMAFASSLPAALALRFAAGIANAIMLVCTTAWCIEALNRRGRGELAGWVFSGVGWGIAGAGLACMALMVAGVGADAAWLVLGGLAAIGSMFAWPRGSEGASAAGGATGRFPWSARTVKLVLCYTALGFGYIIPATFLPAMARQTMPDPRLFGWVWPIFGVAAALSTVLIARTKGVDHRHTWIAGNVAMAVGLLVPAAFPMIATMALAGLLVGGTFMVITMAALQAAREAEPSHARALIAVMTAGFALGQMIGPLVANRLGGAEGDPARALVLAAVLLGVSSLALRK